MAARKRDKREREAERSEAEPMATEQVVNQASIQQFPAESSRARVWQMHLRGVPKRQIAEAVGINRETVARIIAQCYADIAPEQKVSPARKLREAVARMRLVEEQAWNDHDADDEREQRVLALSVAQTTQTAADATTKETKEARPSNVSIRYQSQRGQYLRIILDAEKEIARLEGLYEGLLDVEGAGAVFRITKISPEAASALSAANTRSLAAPAEAEHGESAGS